MTNNIAIKNKNNSGFTLLELMITTGILAIFISGFFATIIGLFSLNENSRKLALSITAVQDKMEEVRNHSPFFDDDDGDGNDDNGIFATFDGDTFDVNGLPVDSVTGDVQAKGTVFIDNTDPDLLIAYITASWRERSNRTIGEDVNLNGAFDAGEDVNGDGRLSSPAEIVTLIGRR
ncbi:prepilin-type N-terminal cleavage/methylation domain-containing protein [Candidatus Omnitrophota bacterium]